MSQTVTMQAQCNSLVTYSALPLLNYLSCSTAQLLAKQLLVFFKRSTLKAQRIVVCSISALYRQLKLCHKTAWWSTHQPKLELEIVAIPTNLHTSIAMRCDWVLWKIKFWHMNTDPRIKPRKLSRLYSTFSSRSKKRVCTGNVRWLTGEPLKVFSRSGIQ